MAVINTTASATTTDPCLNVGPALPDVAGIGILTSFGGQAFLSLMLAVWVFFLSEMGHLDVNPGEAATAVRRKAHRLAAYSDMLMVGNDIQLLLGVAYMLTSWAERNRIGLYHQRLFAACYALKSGLVLYDLRVWTTDPTAGPGVCYVTSGAVAAPGSPHPASDMAYVAVTATSLLVSMGSGAFLGPSRRKLVLLSAFLHYPLHLYFMVAVRHANQDFLSGERGTGPAKEDEWDFGQTTAMSLLVVSVLEVGEKWWEHRRWFRDDVRGSVRAHLVNPVDDGVWLVGSAGTRRARVTTM